MENKYLKKVDLIFCRNMSGRSKEVLKKTFQRNPDDIINDIIDSGLKGRGGAGFPTGLKWKYTRSQESDVKYVVCNADEGEPGTFKDREILDRVPQKVFTGMAICAYCIGAKEGYLYLRGEYNFLLEKLNSAIDDFNAKLKTLGLDFHIQIRSGSGAYVCGEETALFESIEGKQRENPRNKPPFPTVSWFIWQTYSY